MTHFILGRKDRSGAQIQKYISGLNYAQQENVKVAGMRVFKYIQETSQLIELLGLPPPLKSTHGLKELTFGKKEIFGKKFSLSFLNELRSKFSYQKKENRDYLHIGIHIRRGDVSNIKNSNRFLPNDYYLNILKQIKKITDHNLKIDIFSEKNSCESFDIFTKNFSNCHIHLDTNLKDCWKTLINSDILIMSKGSFSFIPAIYNQNIVIYNKGLSWQDRISLESWIKYNPNTLNKQLKEHISNYLNN